MAASKVDFTALYLTKVDSVPKLTLSKLYSKIYLLKKSQEISQTRAGNPKGEQLSIAIEFQEISRPHLKIGNPKSEESKERREVMGFSGKGKRKKLERGN